VRIAPNWWVFVRDFVSVDDRFNVTGLFDAAVSARQKSRFPETETDSGGDSFEWWTPLDVNITATESRAEPCPLLGVKGTSVGLSLMSVFDPKRTL